MMPWNNAPLFVGVAGYGTLLLAFAVALALSLRWSRLPDRSLDGQFACVLVFVTLCVVAFVHIPRIYRLLADRGEALLLSPGFQYGIAAFGMGLLAQLVALRWVKALFPRMLLVSSIGAAACVVFLIVVEGGIISTVWMVVFSMSIAIFMSAIAMFRDIDILVEGAARIGNTELKFKTFDSARTQVNGVLKTGMTGFLALGASVGVSMSILFGRGEEAWANPSIQLSATRLVLGFAMITLGIAIWIVRPYFASLSRLQATYISAVGDIGRQEPSSPAQSTQPQSHVLR